MALLGPVASVLLAATAACLPLEPPGPEPLEGSEGGPCYPNNTCDAELQCDADGLCAAPRGGDGESCYTNATCDEGFVCLAAGSCAPEIAWGPCAPGELPPGYRYPTELECALLEVPLDWSAPQGEQISLRIGRQPARTAAETAVFQLAGGPGGSSVAQAYIVDYVMPGLRDTLDVVYVDQRGTGGSGYMGCADAWPQSRTAWELCAGRHNGVGLDHYLSEDAADDLDYVRQRLGYDKIMLRGGSYGTRLGLEYVRRHEAHVAAIVLDGLVPPDDDFFSETTQKEDRGVELLVADCAADTHCGEVAPQLEADLLALLERAQTDPRTINVGGANDEEDAELFKIALGAFVEDWYWRHRLPRAVTAAADGDYALWDAMLTELFGVTITSNTAATPRHVRPARRADTLAQDSYVAPGLYMAVVCAEFLPNAPSLTELRALADAQVFGDDNLVQLAEACAAWEVESIPESLRQPVISDVPALFLSGAADVITRPERGAHAASSFTNGHHLVLPDATHAVMVFDCGARVIEAYLEAHGNLDLVDTSCFDSYEIAFD